MRLAVTERGRQATSGKISFRPEHSFDFNLLIRLELGGPATIEELENEIKGDPQEFRSSARRLFESGLIEDLEDES